MAPEMIRNQAYTDKVDIWSLGVIIFELLTGSFPFGSGFKTRMDLFKAIVKGSPNFDSWTNLSSQAKDFLKKMLEKNPDNRLSAEELLAEDWILNNREFDLKSNDIVRVNYRLLNF